MTSHGGTLVLLVKLCRAIGSATTQAHNLKTENGFSLSVQSEYLHKWLQFDLSHLSWFSAMSSLSVKLWEFYSTDTDAISYKCKYWHTSVISTSLLKHPCTCTNWSSASSVTDQSKVFTLEGVWVWLLLNLKQIVVWFQQLWSTHAADGYGGLSGVWVGAGRTGAPTCCSGTSLSCIRTCF